MVLGYIGLRNSIKVKPVPENYIERRRSSAIPGSPPFLFNKSPPGSQKIQHLQYLVCGNIHDKLRFPPGKRSFRLVYCINHYQYTVAARDFFNEGRFAALPVYQRLKLYTQTYARQGVDLRLIIIRKIQPDTYLETVAQVKFHSG